MANGFSTQPGAARPPFSGNGIPSYAGGRNMASTLLLAALSCSVTSG